MRERETKQTREEEKNKEKPREKSRGVVAEALLDSTDLFFVFFATGREITAL